VIFTLLLITVSVTLTTTDLGDVSGLEQRWSLESIECTFLGLLLSLFLTGLLRA